MQFEIFFLSISDFQFTRYLIALTVEFSLYLYTFMVIVNRMCLRRLTLGIMKWASTFWQNSFSLNYIYKKLRIPYCNEQTEKENQKNSAFYKEHGNKSCLSYLM